MLVPAADEMAGTFQFLVSFPKGTLLQNIEHLLLVGGFDYFSPNMWDMFFPID